jgi:hypothetical protein
MSICSILLTIAHHSGAQMEFFFDFYWTKTIRQWNQPLFYPTSLNIWYGAIRRIVPCPPKNIPAAIQLSTQFLGLFRDQVWWFGTMERKAARPLEKRSGIVPVAARNWRLPVYVRQLLRINGKSIRTRFRDFWGPFSVQIKSPEVWAFSIRIPTKRRSINKLRLH